MNMKKTKSGVRVLLRTLSVIIALLLSMTLLVGCDTGELENERAALQASLSDAMKEIEALRASQTEAQEKIGQLESSQTESQETIDRLESSQAEAEEKIDQMEASRTELQETIDRLEEQNEEALAQLEQLKAEDQAIRDYIDGGNMFVLVENQWITPYNAEDVLQDGGSISYDATNQVLTLNHANVTVKDSFLRAFGDLSLKLIGENKITVEASEEKQIVGILCGDGQVRYDLFLWGEGSLELTMKTEANSVLAVGVSAAELTVQSESLTVLAGRTTGRSSAIQCDQASFSETAVSLRSEGIVNNEGLRVSDALYLDQSSLVVQNTIAATQNEGIWTGGSICLTASSVQVDVEHGEGTFHSVYSKGSISLDENSTLEGEKVVALNGVWEPEDSDKIRIYIDQGHNPSYHHNSGAQGNGLFEENLTYEIGHLLADLLEQDGRFLICLSRPTEDTVLGTDKDSSLEARVQGAKDFEADYFISIHINAFELSSAHGTEVYTLSSEGEAYLFGSSILKGLIDETEMKDRGVKTSAFYVLKHATMPAALLELGFITNPDDAAMLDEHPELFAQGIYNGILAHFNLSAE